MYARPQLYLNGTGPFNVTGASHACVFQENESQHDRGVVMLIDDRFGEARVRQLLPRWWAVD